MDPRHSSPPCHVPPPPTPQNAALRPRRTRRGDPPDGRHDRTPGDEVQEGREEPLALLLGVVLPGEVLADGLEFQGRDGQTLAFDSAEDLAYEEALHAVGLDQYQGPLS